jgi:hypothetical protein
MLCKEKQGNECLRGDEQYRTSYDKEERAREGDCSSGDALANLRGRISLGKSRLRVALKRRHERASARQF